MHCVPVIESATSQTGKHFIAGPTVTMRSRILAACVSNPTRLTKVLDILFDAPSSALIVLTQLESERKGERGRGKKKHARDATSYAARTTKKRNSMQAS